MNRTFVWTAGAVLIVAGTVAWWWTTHDEVGKLEYRTAKIERGAMTAVVAASGSINPVESVQVSSPVSGQLKEVLVDYNSEVRQGQVLARIDPETFRLRVNQSQADLDAAQAQVLVQESQMSQRRAEISRVEVNLGETRRDLARKEELVAKNFISIAERDRVMAQLRIQDEDLKTARAGLAIAIAQVRNSEALVKQRQAALESARVDLERTVIRSPVDGIVINRAVDAGETVAASLQAPTMFLIARNLRDMQVETSIDESDITRIRNDQKVTFTVDAFPGRSFQGVVTQVRKAAQNVQNVVTYIVVVTFSNADGALQPGMTANVRVVTDVREDILKVANAALRLRLPGEGATPPTAAISEPAPAPAIVPAPASGPGAGATAGASARAGSAGGGGSLGAFRARLEQELALTPGQQKQLDTVFAGIREKFMGLRALPEEQRGKLGQAYRAELRDAVGEILTTEQKKRYEVILVEIAGRAGAGGRGRVYVLDNGKPRALTVRTGISDGTATEVSGAGVAEGTEVIIEILGKPGAARPQGKPLPRLL